MTTTKKLPTIPDYIEQHRAPDGVQGSFANNCEGHAAVVFAVRQLLYGDADIARFIVCQHPARRSAMTEDSPTRYFGVGIGEIDGIKCFRWLGEAFNPVGAGSHSVIATWQGNCMDADAVTAAITATLYAGARDIDSPVIFRNLDDFDLVNGHAVKYEPATVITRRHQ